MSGDTSADTGADLFDLDTAVEVTEAEHIVKHPGTGAATTARIVIAGPQHSVRKSAWFARMRQRQAEFARTGQVPMSDPEENDEDQTAFVAACTLGWSGLSRGGQPLPFTIGAALALYRDPKFRWLRDQVQAALDQRELFIGACATP